MSQSEPNHNEPAEAKPEVPSTGEAKTEKGKEGGDAPAPAAAEFLNIKVISQNGEEVFFKIKKHTPLRKLFGAYCQRMGVTENAIRFLFDGSRIQPDQTPKDLGMENDDVIDAMLHQTGGF